MDILCVKFLQFHAENPQIYELFKRFAFQALRRGHKNLSADLVMHRVRWETSIETTDPDFKIANAHVAFYSRMFMLDHPLYGGFFRTCESAADELFPRIAA